MVGSAGIWGRGPGSSSRGWSSSPRYSSSQSSLSPSMGAHQDPKFAAREGKPCAEEFFFYAGATNGAKEGRGGKGRVVVLKYSVAEPRVFEAGGRVDTGGAGVVQLHCSIIQYWGGQQRSRYRWKVHVGGRAWCVKTHTHSFLVPSSSVWPARGGSFRISGRGLGRMGRNGRVAPANSPLGEEGGVPPQNFQCCNFPRS